MAQPQDRHIHVGPVKTRYWAEGSEGDAVHAQAAAQGFPDVRLHIFNDCGHLPMLEQTAAFNDELLGFLSP